MSDFMNSCLLPGRSRMLSSDRQTLQCSNAAYHALQEQEYDPLINAEYWRLRPVLVLQRTIQIGRTTASVQYS